MLNLNLLPPKEKENLAYAMKRRAVIAVGAALAAAALTSIALLLPTFFLLVFQKSEVVRAVDLASQSNARAGVDGVMKEIKEINQLAAKVLGHKSGRIVISDLFESVFKDLPPSVRIRSLRFDAASKDLVIDGFSPTRQAILDFVNNLKANSFAAKVFSPTSNIIREADIDFTVTLSVK